MFVGKPGIFLCTSHPVRGLASSESTVGAPHVSPARKGWEKVASEIPSAVGAIPSPRAAQGSALLFRRWELQLPRNRRNRKRASAPEVAPSPFLIFRIPHWPLDRKSVV